MLLHIRVSHRGSRRFEPAAFAKFLRRALHRRQGVAFFHDLQSENYLTQRAKTHTQARLLPKVGLTIIVRYRHGQAPPLPDCCDLHLVAAMACDAFLQDVGKLAKGMLGQADGFGVDRDGVESAMDAESESLEL
jgi:hypothetical protein